MIRVEIPAHLRTLASVKGELQVDVPPPVTIRAVIEALERSYPTLQGTIREHGASRRRPLVRFFACEEDYSNASFDTPLPDAVTSGAEPFIIIGAIAGG